MSLGREFPSVVPESTEKLAKKVFKKKKNIYVMMGDTISSLFANKDFQDLYSNLGQHATNPVVMTLITLVQFIENLSDREVMAAIPGRIDLKYLLRLPLDHQGFDASDLVKFRKRLIEGAVHKEIFDRVLEFANEKGLVKKDKQRTDSTHVLAAVSSMSRIELIIEAMRNALDCLAKKEPKFVRRLVDDFLMLNAYTERGMNFRMPKKDNEKKKLAESVAEDAKFLLAEIDREPELSHLKQLKPIVMLRRILGEQFDINDRGHPRLKEPGELAKSQYLIGSPHDSDARYSTKRNESWLGYKLQVTETCDSRFSPIITDIQLTKSTVSDSEMLHRIQRSLVSRDLVPRQQLVDSGYTSAEAVKRSAQKYSIKLLGPVQPGNSWQGDANKGFSSSHFAINWAERFATCPAGKRSKRWVKRKDQEAIHVSFNAATCQSCRFKNDCTKSVNGGRNLELKTQELFELQKAQAKESESTAFWKTYKKRAGIEGTISRITSHFGMRRSRYVGLRKAEFQAKIAAAAMNVVRICANLMQLAKPGTRISPFNELLLQEAV